MNIAAAVSSDMKRNQFPANGRSESDPASAFDVRLNDDDEHQRWNVRIGAVLISATAKNIKTNFPARARQTEKAECRTSFVAQWNEMFGRVRRCCCCLFFVCHL